MIKIIIAEYDGEVEYAIRAPNISIAKKKLTKYLKGTEVEEYAKEVADDFDYKEVTFI